MSGSLFATPPGSAEKQEKTSQETLSSSINLLVLMQGILDRLDLPDFKFDRDPKEGTLENLGNAELYEDRNSLSGTDQQHLRGRDPDLLEGQERLLLEGREDLPATLEPSDQLPGEPMLGIKVGDYMLEAPLPELERMLVEAPPEKLETLQMAFADPENRFVREPITLSVDGEVKHHYETSTPLLEETVATLNKGFEQCFDGPGPHVIEGDNYVITQHGENFSIWARDGRGAILDVQDGLIQKSDLNEGDILRFEVGSNMIDRHVSEVKQIPPDRNIEIQDGGITGGDFGSKDIEIGME